MSEWISVTNKRKPKYRLLVCVASTTRTTRRNIDFQMHCFGLSMNLEKVTGHVQIAFHWLKDL